MSVNACTTCGGPTRLATLGSTSNLGGAATKYQRCETCGPAEASHGTGMDQGTFEPAIVPKDTETLDIFAVKDAKAAETGGKVIDLMEALKASLATAANVTAPSDSEGMNPGGAS